MSPATSTNELPIAHHCEYEQRDADLLPQSEDDERRTRDHEPDEEGGAQAPRARQRQRSDSSHERADADRRVQVADAALPEVEEIDRSDDDEHLDGAEHRRLRGQEEDHHAQGRVPAERREARETLRRDRRRVQLSLRLLRSLHRHEQEEERGDDDQRRP